MLNLLVIHQLKNRRNHDRDSSGCLFLISIYFNDVISPFFFFLTFSFDSEDISTTIHSISPHYRKNLEVRPNTPLRVTFSTLFSASAGNVVKHCLLWLMYYFSNSGYL